MRDCACGFFCSKLDPNSAAWHRAHRAVHLEVFPAVDAGTIANLNTIVDMYERREQRAAERVS